jgi:hypothetical protein
MKNIKNILTAVVTAAVLYCSQTIQCSASLSAPDVEIYNKSNEDITVFITNLDNQVPRSINVAKGMAVKYDTDINSELKFEIWSLSNKNANRLLAVATINAPGKTKYLTWNPEKKPSLYPQTGPLLGLMGKTQSGLSLKDNVSSSMIKNQ